ncbi:hypothetical protein Y032_0022g540 [Ancylostoma ceylanicum]|uniref:Uncharacterized protein n=1 Tax=Ancylostoma ceylanicum TaxID=53326 RepID=A0A016UYJ7_9BILA|nr:hypothetical protein Y032_0022g540 [Ancylostoma ceylanicum]
MITRHLRTHVRPDGSPVDISVPIAQLSLTPSLTPVSPSFSHTSPQVATAGDVRQLFASVTGNLEGLTHSLQCAQPVKHVWCDAWDRMLSRVSTPFPELYFLEAVIISKLIYSSIPTNAQTFYIRDGRSRHPLVLL